MSLSSVLSSPAGALAELYSSEEYSSTDAFPSAVSRHFSDVFKKREDLDKIPTLDLKHPPQSFPNGSLVIFHAMIQDTSLSSDLYLATRNNGSCGGWGITDDITSKHDFDTVDYKNMRESTAFWAVSIPGISPWCLGSSEVTTGSVWLPIQPHKYPCSEQPFIGAQLKIYDESISQPLRTTDIGSFVGILTSELLQGNSNHDEAQTEVPTLHVLFSIPIISGNIARPLSVPLPETPISVIREQLIDWIATEALGGDKVAAEWVILASISRIRSRQPPILPLSLTISSFPSHQTQPNSTPVLHGVLSQIFPLVTPLSVSLDALNTTSFNAESKDEDLHAGRLQLPKKSILLLSEGAVREGSIGNKGVLNIRALQEVINSQTLDYIFPFNSFNFETDLNVLITTEGRKSTFFETAINVPWKPHDIPDSTEYLYKELRDLKLPSTEKLLLFRQLVRDAQRDKITVSETVGKYIEDDFIRERNESKPDGQGQPIITPDNLIQRMLVARLRALSLHQSEVTVADWESAKELERETKSRKT